MFKKLFTLFIALVVGSQPALVSANDLESAFQNLLGPGIAASINQPGRYQSGARNAFVAGGLELRVPSGPNMPQLVSFTPPRVVAGCNGISAHFGGFSFISGEEFKQTLRSIASGAAMGFVSLLAMKVLCGQCEQVVQYLQSAAQAASRLARDSCEWGRRLAEEVVGTGSKGSGNTQELCGTTVADANHTSDFADAMSKLCNSVKSAVDKLNEINPQAQGDSEEAQANKAALECTISSGNQTWLRLQAFDGTSTGSSNDSAYLRKLLVLNMTGAELKNDEETWCETESGEPLAPSDQSRTVFCQPRLTAQEALGLFMCGAPDASGNPNGSTSSRVNEYCKSFYTPVHGSGMDMTKKVYVCKNNDKTRCSVLELADVKVLFRGRGFLVQVNNLLMQGVDAVRRNQPLPEEVVKLIQVAPYPLYQAINAAAVYPAAAADLLDAMSAMVAEQFAYAVFDDTIRLSGRANSNVCKLSAAEANTIINMLAQLRNTGAQRRALMASNLTMQEALTEQIRSLNLAIQRQVMTTDLLSTGQYSQALNKAVASASAGGPAPVQQ